MRVGLSCLLLGVASPAWAQPCNDALPVLSSASGTPVNTYYTGFQPVTVVAGATNIRIDSALTRGAAATLVAGDMLIVMQMQDAQFNNTQSSSYGDGVAGDPGQGSTAVNNSGVYEYVVAQGPIFTGGACGAGATCIPIRGAGGAPNDGLVNGYVSAAAVAGAGGRGRRTFQVIRVPRYASGTLYSTLTGLVWSPANRNGGVLAIDVVGNLALNTATVSVDSLGYQGGFTAELEGEAGTSSADYRRPQTDDAHGPKGEGIAGTPSHLGGDGYPQGDRARGAPGTAGGGGSDADPSAIASRCNADGNDENTGGGGGANGGNGGKGGDGWNPSTGGCTVATITTGGFGGGALPAAARTPGRLNPGGGGGAGTRNNTGPASGGDGGGIVMIRAGTVTGTGTIRARGQSPACTDNDGGGGAGAGGTILFYAEGGTLAGLTADVQGGRGGDANRGGACTTGGGAHGPGGGGGGGFIYVSGAVAVASSVAGGANGLSQGDIAYGSTAGSPGPAIDTTLTVSEIPGVQTCTNATRATLAGLRVDPGGLVEFATGSQRRTLAFNLYATSDATGRGRRTPLTERPVRAALPDTSRPTLYRVETPSFLEPFVAIEEIELSGRPRLLGSFRVDDPVLRGAFERIAALSAGAREARGAIPKPLALERTLAPRARPRGTPLMSTTQVKVEVRQAGQVTVGLDELVAAGLPEVARQSPEGITVWNLGQPVARQIVAGPGGQAQAVTFPARTLSTDYTDRNAFVVAWGSQIPPLPAARLSRSGPPLRTGLVRVERDTLHVPSLPPGADPWVWDYFISGVPGAPQTFDLPTLSAGGGAIPVTLYLTGATDHEHKVMASLNGHVVGVADFTGRTLGQIDGVLPAGSLRVSGNELTFAYEAAGSTEEDWGAVFFDGADLGFAEDLTAPIPVERLAGYEPAARVEGADYLIVTHSKFRAQADRLAALKAAEGLRTAVVDIERIYDALSGGVQEAAAVRAFLRTKVGRGLRYVLLFGDDTFDPRDNLGLGAVAYVPSLPAWDGEFGRVASENRYADLNDDGRPELAIGRLPVKTPAEADLLVDKIARQDEILAQVGPTHVFAVDDRSSAGDVDFSAKAERAVGLLPPGSSATWVFADRGEAARTLLRERLRAGALATHYFGHGGPDVWADEHLLDTSDLPSLAGGGRGTVVFTWSCETQWYQYDLEPSINEGLLLVPDGGALASVGPTGISDPNLQSGLADRVYTYFLQGQPLGEAVRRAKDEALQANPATRPVIDGWSLLGDPSLHAPAPTARRRDRK